MEVSLKKVERALLSVSDKTGIVQFARKLADHGIDLVSTGGTAAILRQNGLAVRDISDLTGFPEMLDGRVKTLHPLVHGGLLGIRDNSEHRAKMEEHRIVPIDMVVVNLYPFRQTILKPGVSLEEAIENIDIGGPAMIRSGSKNHRDVAVVVDPGDYERIGEALDANGGSLSHALRFELAQQAFQHTAAYDAEIARYLASQLAPGESSGLPERLEITLEKAADLRYGENPHQQAALYRLPGSDRGIATAEQLQGKELSYNNLLDSDAAWELVLEIHRMHLA
ncbi:MAG: bifunctional phosphoribosylaminoimidazolecarboxamide formyltransferase/IMP cyclohydrolase, partial [Acidobacteriota bacterium]